MATNNCRTLQNISLPCQYSAAGLSELYLAPWSSDIQIVMDETVTTSVKTITLPEEDKWYTIELANGTASYTDTLQVNGASRSKVQTINFAIGVVTPELAPVIDSLALGKFVAIARTAAGVYRLFGLQKGLQATTLEDASGTADTDQSQISITLSGTATESAQFIVDKSAFEAQLAPDAGAGA